MNDIILFLNKYFLFAIFFIFHLTYLIHRILFLIKLSAILVKGKLFATLAIISLSSSINDYRPNGDDSDD